MIKKAWTLEQIQAARKSLMPNKMADMGGYPVVTDFISKQDLQTIKYALTLAERVALGEVVLEQPWQPIETAPIGFYDEPDTHIMLAENQGSFYHNVTGYYRAYKNGLGVMCRASSQLIEKPTHWKPLPQPPQEASE